MSKIPVNNNTGEIPDVKPGVYEAVCIRVKDDFLEHAQFGDGNVVRLYMQLDLYDTDGEPVVLDAIANRVISPKSKLARWAEAMGVPVDFEAGGEFDTEMLLAGECLVKITRKDAQMWPRIEDVTARPTGKAPASNGAVDFTTFWSQVKAMGLEREDVRKHLPGQNMLAMQDMSGADLVELLEKLSA